MFRAHAPLKSGRSARCPPIVCNSTELSLRRRPQAGSVSLADWESAIVMLRRILEGARGQPARIRHRRPQSTQSRDRHRRGVPQLVAELKAHGMGLILDIVPNHMGVGYGTNPWWQDVLAERARLSVRRFFRHRLGAAEARAAQQSSASDTRKAIRRRSGAGQHQVAFETAVLS